MSEVSYTRRILLFKVLSNDTRLRLIDALLKGDKSVNELCGELLFQQSRVSHELRCLTVCGLVSFRREGRKMIYSMNKGTIIPILDAVDRHVSRFGDRMEMCDLITDARKVAIHELTV